MHSRFFGLFWIVMILGYAAAPGADFPLVDAVECHPRGGLPNFFGKLKAGGEVRIAYLGGSITEAQGWRPLTLKWFQEQYPKARIREINAAISGTGSDFGAFRLEQEVLRHKPDLLFVEFAVNDGARDPQRIIQSMEGIVRQVRQHDPAADICFVYTLSEAHVETLRGGKFPRSASAMERVANHYAIPSIHLGLEVVRLAGEDKLVFTGKPPQTAAEKSALGDKILFSPDGTHPYPETGHPLYLDAIVRSLPSLEAAGKSQPHAPSIPLDPDNWQKARLIPLASVGHTGDWQKVDPASIPGRSGKGRTFQVAGQPGDALTFRFRGTGFGIYSLKGPDVGRLAVTVDGGKPLVTTLFDSLCVENRFRIRPWIFPHRLEEGEHTVKIEVHPELPNKADILKKPADAPQFAARNFYVSDLLILGEIKN